MKPRLLQRCYLPAGCLRDAPLISQGYVRVRSVRIDWRNWSSSFSKSTFQAHCSQTGFVWHLNAACARWPSTAAESYRSSRSACRRVVSAPACTVALSDCCIRTSPASPAASTDDTQLADRFPRCQAHMRQRVSISRGSWARTCCVPRRGTETARGRVARILPLLSGYSGPCPSHVCTSTFGLSVLAPKSLRLSALAEDCHILCLDPGNLAVPCSARGTQALVLRHNGCCAKRAAPPRKCTWRRGMQLCPAVRDHSMHSGRSPPLHAPHSLHF